MGLPMGPQHRGPSYPDSVPQCAGSFGASSLQGVSEGSSSCGRVVFSAVHARHACGGMGSQMQPGTDFVLGAHLRGNSDTCTALQCGGWARAPQWGPCTFHKVGMVCPTCGLLQKRVRPVCQFVAQHFEEVSSHRQGCSAQKGDLHTWG